MRLLSVAFSRRWAKGWVEHSLSAGRPAVHFLYEQELLSLSPRPIGRCQAAPRTLAFVSLCTHTREYIIIVRARRRRSQVASAACATGRRLFRPAGRALRNFRSIWANACATMKLFATLIGSYRT